MGLSKLINDFKRNKKALVGIIFEFIIFWGKHLSIGTHRKFCDYNRCNLRLRTKLMRQMPKIDYTLY